MNAHRPQLPPMRSADDDGNALTMSAISKSFVSEGRSVKALDEVELRVSAGRITGLVGPDGAGKTTLMRLAAGLLQADTGSIRVLGLDATRDPLMVQRSIGYMPQRFGLYEDLSVQENLDLYADLQGVPHAIRAQRYHDLTKMTGLEHFTRRLAGRLSGGMKQKLGLACTLVQPPQLLLLDEPTVGVDPVSRRELWVIINKLILQHGTSVLVSTAYLDEAENCHEVALLHNGHCLGQDTPARFTARVEGRTYSVSAAGLSKRALHDVLADTDDVVDAVVQGNHVRIVASKNEPPKNIDLPNSVDLSIVPVPARFEDGFVTLLRAHLRPEDPARHHLDFKIAATTPTRASADAVIQVRELSRRFGPFYAVKNISFAVQRGEVFGLLGANGAGKSTTFRMLCGLLPPSSGHLSVAGLDLRRAASAARARIGYMSQKFSLYGNLTVRDNLQFFSSIYGLSGASRSDRIKWSLEQFTLDSVKDNRSIDLPLGFKQRLALACALMHEPDILFLDEPTSGVDPLARREFWHRINHLAEAGVTILVTTHFMEEAEYCDRLAIMDAGEILALGTPDEIKVSAADHGGPISTLEDAFIALLDANAKVRSEQ